MLQRIRLEEFFQAYLPGEDRRTKVPAARGLLVLVKNILISRDPIYGVGDWAAGYAPDLLGLSQQQVAALNDDRVGRCLYKLFACDQGSLALAVTGHVVREFEVELDQLHNDSTTITFFGAYTEAAEEKFQRGGQTLAITFGHNKDHRPDLKQLLYILTVARDGGVPIYFTAASGNVTDDKTHCATWDLLCRLTGRRDFLYVADSKLATKENMGHIARNHGRFISVLPRTRKEDAAFRQQLLAGQVTWRHLYDKTDQQGELVDRLSACQQPATTAEGYRLLWFHSTRKAELDAVRRSHQIDRALGQLAELREKLHSPRTRYREKAKVEKAAAEILTSCGVEGWIAVQIKERALENYRQAKPGRPGKNTRYVKREATRFDIEYEIDTAKVAEARATDGVFPLVTNVDEFTEREILDAYKKQPLVEKRFSQLKTDFEVAPVYLKEVRRIQALLCVYFFVLLVEALLERELRRAMQRDGIKSLPMYPESRPCRRPTARRLIDLFRNVQRHTLTTNKNRCTVFVTDLCTLQRKILKLFRLPATTYGH
jgi:transposase